MTKSTLPKDNILLGLACSFRDLVYYHHCGKHDSIQTDMELEKELWFLHLDPQAARRRLDVFYTEWGLSIADLKDSPYSVALALKRPHLLMVPLPTG